MHMRQTSKMKPPTASIYKMAGTKAIAIGCICGILSSATQSVGLTLQRKWYVLEEQQQQHRKHLWRVGLLLFLLANVFGSSVQITTLPLVILSSLQAIGLVFNSIFATLILHEAFSNWSLAGTIFVSLGALFIAFFGAIPEPNHTLPELVQLLKRPNFILWMIVSFVLILLLRLLILLTNVLQLTNRPVTTSLSITPDDNDYNTLYTFTDCLESQPYHLKLSLAIKEKFNTINSRINLTLIKGLLYGLISGILSAHSLLMAKSAVDILVTAILSKSSKDLHHWETYFIVLAFLTFAISQLYFLNRGLELTSTSILYPLVFCTYNIINIFNGLIYFNQWGSLSNKQAMIIAFGTLLIIIGVLCLSWRLDSKSSIDHNNNNNNIPTPDSNSFFFSSKSSNNDHLSHNNLSTDTENTPLLSSVMKNTPNQSHRKKKLSRYTSDDINNRVPSPPQQKKHTDASFPSIINDREGEYISFGSPKIMSSSRPNIPSILTGFNGLSVQGQPSPLNLSPGSFSYNLSKSYSNSSSNSGLPSQTDEYIKITKKSPIQIAKKISSKISNRIALSSPISKTRTTSLKSRNKINHTNDNNTNSNQDYKKHHRLKSFSPPLNNDLTKPPSLKSTNGKYKHSKRLSYEQTELLNQLQNNTI